MFFRISEQAHKQSALDFVDKQYPINKLALNMNSKESFTFYAEWFHQQNNSLPLSKTCKR